MAGLENVPESVHRAILVGIVVYFALLVYAMATGNWIAQFVAYVLFGVIAIGVGGALYAQARRTLAPIGAAGLCLISGGIAQLAWALTGEQLLDTVATIAVLAGIALYVYAVWVDR